MKWIHDGDGEYESQCGRLSISRRYSPGGSNPCIGWGVDVEGVSGTAYLADSFAEAKAWANEEARRRGWDHKLRWECRASGEHAASLPDGAVLVATYEWYETARWWECHLIRGDDTKHLATADTLRELKQAIREMGEEAYR